MQVLVTQIESRPMSQAVTRSSLERQFLGLNLRSVKLDSVLPTAGTAATFL